MTYPLYFWDWLIEFFPTIKFKIKPTAPWLFIIAAGLFFVMAYFMTTEAFSRFDVYILPTSFFALCLFAASYEAENPSHKKLWRRVLNVIGSVIGGGFLAALVIGAIAAAVIKFT